MMLTEEEVPVDIVKSARIFHFGTLSMTHERVRLATKKAIAIAQDAGAIISFDPNIREPLWNSLDDAREQVLYGLQQCDILKISDNEIQWLTGEDDFTEGVRWINMRYHIPLILVSMGKEAGLTIRTRWLRLHLLSKKIRLKLQVPVIRFVRVCCIMCWSMDCRN